MKNFFTLSILLFYTVFCIPLFVQAVEINPLNGALEESLPIPLSEKLTLRLQYSSRSHHFGLFGFAWCSPLEERLKLKGQTPYFVPCPGITKPHQIKSLKNGYEVKKDKSNTLFFDKYGELRFWLIENEKYSIEQRDEKIILKSPAEEIQLIKQFDQSIFQIQIRSLVGKRVQSKAGPNIKFTYSMGKIIKIEGTKGEWRMSYDQFSNLVKLQSDQTWTATFDNQKDAVEKVSLSGGKFLTFSYNAHQSHKNVLQVSEVKSYRGSTLVDHRIYEYRFKKSNNGWQITNTDNTKTALHLKENEL